MTLLAATDARFANFATIALSSGSRMSAIAFSGSTHWTTRCPCSGQVALCLIIRVVVGLTGALFITEIADRPRADLPPHARFLEGLARSRLGRRQPLDRPAFGHDPPPRLSRCDDEDFKRRHGREPIGQRAILDADNRPRPSFLWLLGNNRISGESRSNALQVA
jgi:hypothetical protein